MQNNSKQYFRLRAFPNLEDHYEDFIKNDFVALGWPATGNLVGKSKEEVRAALDIEIYKFKNKEKNDIVSTDKKERQKCHKIR